MFKRFQKSAFAVGLSLLAALHAVTPLLAQELRNEIIPSPNDEVAPPPPTAPRSLDTLSFEAQDTAKRLGLWNTLVQFDTMRQQRLSGSVSAADYLEARQNVVESVMVVSQEARTFVHFVEEEVARANAVAAILAAKRDRALKLNTYGDLISGGISGMIGGALAIGDINHLTYDTIDAVEGLVQTVLAVWSLYEQKGEKRIEKGIPNILSRLFEPDKGPSPAYPQSVWTFLNSPGAPGGQTRREKLVADWTKEGFCLLHHGRRHFRRHDEKERQARITNTTQSTYRITSDLIEDRNAMLHQLRSSVTRLDVVMLELLLYMRSNTMARSRPSS
ncbi:MAG: hypothetical protein C0507_17600 [Cyanobacteria bacterium PR.3.49]|nr:hypothetical protein [Cyanobacteria bacterium PR.3.49]